MRHGRAGPTRPRCLPRSASDRNAPAIARASALTELGSRVSPSNIDLARTGSRRSRPDGADRRARHARGRADRQLWPLVSPLLVRSRSRRAHQGRRRCLPASRRRASLPPTASASSARRPSSSPRSASMPIGPKRAPRSELSTPGAARAAEAEAEYKAALRLEPAICARGDQPRRSLSAARAGRRRRRACCARRSPRHRATRGCTTRSALTLIRLKRPDEALGELRRASRARARPGAIRLCLCGRAAFRRPRRRGHDRSQGEPGAPSGGSRHPAGAHQLQPRRRRSRARSNTPSNWLA